VNQVFVDSSVWIDHLRGKDTPQTRAFHAMLASIDPGFSVDQPYEIIVGDLVLFEVMRGVGAAREYAAALRMLDAFTQVSIGGNEIALAAAAHFRRLRQLGITVRKSVDCLIAAWCIANDVTLLHNDRDFGPFEVHCGLRVFDAEAERRPAH